MTTTGQRHDIAQGAGRGPISQCTPIDSSVIYMYMPLSLLLISYSVVSASSGLLTPSLAKLLVVKLSV